MVGVFQRFGRISPTKRLFVAVLLPRARLIRKRRNRYDTCALFSGQDPNKFMTPGWTRDSVPFRTCYKAFKDAVNAAVKSAIQAHVTELQSGTTSETSQGASQSGTQNGSAATSENSGGTGESPTGGTNATPQRGHTVRSLLSNRVAQQRNLSAHNTRIYRVANYTVQQTGSLVDGGANGGLAGSDVRVMCQHPTATADVKGIADNDISNIPICTVSGLINTDKGPAIAIMHQYAYHGEGRLSIPLFNLLTLG